MTTESQIDGFRTVGANSRTSRVRSAKQHIAYLAINNSYEYSYLHFKNF
jgi:hypothetical protein